MPLNLHSPVLWKVRVINVTATSGHNGYYRFSRI